MFGWKGEWKILWWGPSIYSPSLPKSFFSKIRRKIRGENMSFSGPIKKFSPKNGEKTERRKHGFYKKPNLPLWH